MRRTRCASRCPRRTPGGADITRDSGLRVLRDRLAAVDDQLQVRPALGAGTTLIDTLPFDAATFDAATFDAAPFDTAPMTRGLPPQRVADR